MGKLSEERYTKMANKYEDEAAKLKVKIRELNREINKEDSHITTADEFLFLIRRYAAAAPTVKLGGTGEKINPKTGFTESQQKIYEQIILSAMSGPTTAASAMGGHMSREEATAFQLKSRNR